MKTAEEDGTIIEFLLGEKPFNGVWFGDINPNNPCQFWWRKYLREYASQLKTVEPENILPKAWISETGALMSDEDYQFLSDSQKAKMQKIYGIVPDKL